MGLLDHLWDDTVAGPPPENGLGKLRKHHTFASRSSPGKELADAAGSVRPYGVDSPEDATRVTRSIMIVKPPGYQSPSGSAPASPAGSTPPVSPFSAPLSPFSGKEPESRFGFEEGRHQMRTRRLQAKKDQALLLLSMCEK
ncbi:dormancy-associated protein homolog 3 isoform X2 [Lotus japonicus]|uniref:dormancy-associated protein homolog 3 isoform X2 n=1 Tax=Lotus japonicus TaxID=34305 RepID=UPI002583BF40|nr:dormancy-associated protein homolog 3 isoform X2 [Lotus japonicus]